METTSFTKKSGEPAPSSAGVNSWDGIVFPVPESELELLPAALDDVHRACQEMEATARATPGWDEERRTDGITPEFTM
jgi:hypothetical protein